MKFAFGEPLRHEIRTRLDRFQRHKSLRSELRPAAVAVVLMPDESSGETCFLLTRRPKSLRHHGGQYALPGGRVELEEHIQDTAIREVGEEIGLELDATALLGWLDDFETRSGFSISPCVMWASGGDIRPDRNEVEKVFHIPLWDLNRPEIPRLQPVQDSPHPVLSAPFETLGHDVYAPTAAILYQFREVGLNGRSTRVAHFEQPRFAWK